MKRFSFILIFLLGLWTGYGAVPPDLDLILKKVQKSMKEGNSQAALDLSQEAVKFYPTNITALAIRAKVLNDLGKQKEAITAYDKVIASAPNDAEAYQDRGLNEFKEGKVKESLADFDKYLTLVPRAAPYHWQRGISCYYAEKYDEGRKQFELHSSVNPNDVENAAWHFACVAKLRGFEKARANLLPVHGDSRIPMREIYKLYEGKGSSEEVMAAAHTGNPATEADALFYAWLYLALYHEAQGDSAQAMSDIREAVKKAPLNNYMSDAAFVHRDLREKKPSEAQKTAVPAK